MEHYKIILSDLNTKDDFPLFIASFWEYAEIDDFPDTAKQLAFFQKWMNG